MRIMKIQEKSGYSPQWPKRIVSHTTQEDFLINDGYSLKLANNTKAHVMISHKMIDAKPRPVK